MSQKQNLGYDFTKKMLNTMRNLNENVQSKKVLKEEESQEMFNLVLNDNVEVKIHSTDQEDLSLSDEEKNSLNQLIQNFKSQVSELASFEEGFNIYVDNVRLDGSIEEDLSISDEEKASLNQLIQNFKSQVSELANFEEGFNIYVDSVRLDGTIENDLSFVFIAGNERGLYLNANMLKIEAETAEIINKLEKFQHTFEDVVIEIMNNRKNN